MRLPVAVQRVGGEQAELVDRAAAVEGDRDEQPPPALVAQQRGVGRLDVPQEDPLERPLARKPRCSVELDRPVPGGLGEHVDVVSLREHEGIREMAVLPEGELRRTVPSTLVDLEVADVGAAGAPVVVLEEDVAAAVALEEERVSVEPAGRRHDRRGRRGAPPVGDEPLLLAQPTAHAPAQDPASDAPHEPSHHGVRRPRPTGGRGGRFLERHRLQAVVERSQPARWKVSSPPCGAAAAAMQRDVIGLHDRAVDGPLAVRGRRGAQRDGRHEVGVVHLPEELRLACASAQSACVQSPGAEAGVARQLAGGLPGASGRGPRPGHRKRSVRAGRQSRREGHSRDGVVVAAEDPSVHALVRPVERVAPAPPDHRPPALW